MKIKHIILFLFSFLLVIVSCNEEDDEDLMGNWMELSDFDGVPRSDAVGFVIGSKFYMGTGFDGEDRLQDFWEYDPETNNWTRKADFPGVARNGAIGISINGKGYIGTGFDGEEKLNDFWQYDPTNDSWQQKADFAGSARYGAVAFSIDETGYIGSGYDDNYLKDFYSYSPETDSWTQIVSIGGSKRRDANSFVINGKAYVISGLDNGVYENDIWEYDPSTGIWTEKRNISNISDDSYDNDYTTIQRMNGAAFTINGKGYLACGTTGSLVSSVWKYDPLDDLWEEKTSFEGTIRTETIGFAIGSKGYVTTGRTSSYYLDDIWGFDPDMEYEDYD